MTFAEKHGDEAERLYAGGMTCNQVAAHFTVSGSTVHNCLRARGVDTSLRTRTRNPIAHKHGAAWAARYRAGVGTSIIAQEYGTQRHVVHCELKMRGVQLRPGRGVPRGSVRDEQRHKEAGLWAYEHRAGTPISAIAAREGLKEASVKVRMERWAYTEFLRSSDGGAS